MSNEDRPQVIYGSGAWWASRTDDELRTAIEGNYPGALAHDGAMAELQRREAATERKRQLGWIKLTFWTALVIGVAGVAATFLTAR